ncbi:histidine kinase [bacterium SCSIO 12741]|nr:histidine kinase [bacterium SCSIO 12741]
MLFAVLGFLSGNAQRLISTLYSTNSELSSSETHYVVTGADGYVWIASEYGLSRYDGKEFKTYTIQNGLPGKSNTLLELRKGPNDRIWITSLENDISYIENQQIHPFLYSKDTSYNPGRGEFFCCDTENRKWIFDWYLNALYREKEGGNFVRVFDPCKNRLNEDRPQQFTLIRIQASGTLPYQSQNLDSDVAQPSVSCTGPYIQLTFPANEELRSYTFHYSAQREEYVGIDQHGNYVRFNKDSILSYGQQIIDENDAVSFVYEDREQNFWLGGSNGVYLFRHGNFAEPYEHLMKGHFLTSMSQDLEGNYWFSDFHKGIHKTASIHFRLLDYSTSLNKKVSALRKHQNHLWFSTDQGEIWKVDTHHQAERVYPKHSEPIDFFPFEVLENERLLLPTQNSEIQEFRSTSTIAKDPIIYSRSHGSDIYVGFRLGFLKLRSDPKTGAITTLMDSKNDLFNFQWRTNAINEDGDEVWVGSTHGLYLWKNDSLIPMEQHSSLLGSRIMALEKLTPEYLVIGTKGSGLLLLNKRSKKVNSITEKEGLLSNYIKTLFIQDHTLFIGTNRGLSKLTLTDQLEIENLQNLNIHNGLASNEIWDIIEFNGKIWLATTHGLVYFDDALVKPNNSPPPIYLSEVRVADSLIQKSDGPPQLQKGDRNLLIQYHGVGFRAGNNIRYRYLIRHEDEDSDTVYTSSEEARFINLSPGNYTFRVWAQNEDGYWSEHPAEFSFNIPETFLETIWFQLMLLLLSFFALVLTFFLYLQRRKRIFSQKLQTEELKQQALAALMNPHFIYNSLAAIRHFIHNHDIQQSSRYLGLFSRLIRLNLLSVKNGFIELEDEIERLKLYLEIEQMRFDNKLEFQVNIDPDLDIFDITIPAMIIQPYVENAIWHGILPTGKPGKVTLSIAIIPEQILEIRIHDNGVGISDEPKPKKTHHTSVGMSITKKRLELLSKKTGKSYRVSVGKGEQNRGTEVLIQLAIS